MRFFIPTIFLFFSSFALAQDGNIRLYIATGQGGTHTSTSDGSRPFALGITAHREQTDSIFYGFDMGFEGTRLDSTYGQTNVPNQAISYNGIVGRSFGSSDSLAFDLALLVGFRETEESCPPSNLGFRCYADRDPETSFGINYGGLAMINANNFSVGIRATGESQQVIVGLTF